MILINEILILHRSVQKLAHFNNMKSIFDNKNNMEVRPLHLPFFFLSRGLGIKRLEVVPNGGIGKFLNDVYCPARGQNPKTLLGCKSYSEDKRISFKFPEGKEIGIKPINPPFLRDGSEFEFNLGLLFDRQF